MYKDPDKQREANRQASKKYRDSMTGKGMTVKDERPNEPSNVIPKTDIRVIPEQGVTLTEKEKAARFNALIADKPKRGKDIKTFEDLSPDVQQTIDKMAMVDGKIDKSIKANRTAIAVNYQHLFPNKYYSTGVY